MDADIFYTDKKRCVFKKIMIRVDGASESLSLGQWFPFEIICSVGLATIRILLLFLAHFGFWLFLFKMSYFLLLVACFGLSWIFQLLSFAFDCTFWFRLIHRCFLTFWQPFHVLLTLLVICFFLLPSKCSFWLLVAPCCLFWFQMDVAVTFLCF